MNDLTYESFEEKLVKDVPEFLEILKEHKKENGRILPHVLLGDFTRFVIENYRKSKTDPRSGEVVKKSLDFIEELLQSADPRLKELVQASFLENLDQAGSDFDGIEKLLREDSAKLLKLRQN